MSEIWTNDEIKAFATTLVRRLVPATTSSRILALLMAFVSFLIYLIRVWADQNIYYERGPYGLFAIPFCIAQLCAIAAIIVVLTTIMAMSIRHTESLFPSIVLIMSLVIMFHLPLPTRKPYPEEIIFADRRVDFEYVVELAKQHRLQHNDRVGNSANYLLPSNLADLTEDGLVFLYSLDYQPEHLSVEFNPTGFYYPIMYFENPSDVHTSEECYRDGILTKQLDTHWFLCRRDWN